MKSTKLLLLGVLLSCTVLQLANAKAKPDLDWSSESQSHEDEHPHQEHDDPAHHDEHKDHTGHAGETARQIVPLGAAPPAPPAAAAPTSSDTVEDPMNTNNNEPKAIGGVSGFNESCGSAGNGRICNSNKNLECLAKNSTCQCKEATTYIPLKEGCLPVDSDGKIKVLKFTCEDDRQCQAGKWGAYSICNLDIGKCRCNQNSQWVEDKCYQKRNIGDVCTFHKECRASVNGTHCAPIENSQSETHYCHCLDKHIYDTSVSECVEVPEPNKANKFPCKTNLQCTNSSLGDLSRCGDGKCECFNYANPGDNSIILYENTCFARKQINDTCTSTKECEASHHNSVCLEHEAYMRQTVCQCPEGKTCKQRNGSMGIFNPGMSQSAAVCVAVASVVVGRMTVGSTGVM